MYNQYNQYKSHTKATHTENFLTTYSKRVIPTFTAKKEKREQQLHVNGASSDSIIQRRV